jgi:hypothetical protein
MVVRSLQADVPRSSYVWLPNAEQLPERRGSGWTHRAGWCTSQRMWAPGLKPARKPAGVGAGADGLELLAGVKHVNGVDEGAEVICALEELEGEMLLRLWRVTVGAAILCWLVVAVLAARLLLRCHLPPPPSHLLQLLLLLLLCTG